MNLINHHNYKNSELIRNKKYCPESWDHPNGLFSSNVIHDETSKQISAFDKAPQLQVSRDEFEWSHALFHHELAWQYVQRMRNTQKLEFFKICCLFVCYTKSSPCLPPSPAFVGLNVEKKWGVTNRLSCFCFANGVEFNKCGWAKMSSSWPMQRLILTCHSLVCNLQT